jgi:hypothetical protein
MFARRDARAAFGLGFLLSFTLACAFAAQSSPAKPGKPAKDAKSKKEAKSSSDRTVWNLEGGAYFLTDGGLPNGACFRFSGHATAPWFFNNLKRIDDAEGTTYRRGGEVVTQFPDQLFVTLTIKDSPCSLDLDQTEVRPPLTKEMLGMLRLKLFWKRGVALRPVLNARLTGGKMEALEPYAQDLAKNLPQRFEWTHSLTVPSAGVPLTDSLVFVLETEDGRFAARVAARL